MVCKVQQRYAVQECDATMMRRIIEAGYKKIFKSQQSIFNGNAFLLKLLVIIKMQCKIKCPGILLKFEH
jgi:hypothetical protein